MTTSPDVHPMNSGDDLAAKHGSRARRHTDTSTHRVWPPMLFLLAWMIGGPVVLYAQSGMVAGSVTDESGTALPGVNVVVMGTQWGAATRPDGTFEIKRVPVGEHVVAATAIGYERATQLVEVSAGTTALVEFVLSEVAIQSGEVVVTATRGGRLAGGIAASISTMTPREIEARNAVSLDDALQHVPGVQMAGNQVSIRGSSGFSFNTGSRVLLLLDGMPMLRPDVNGIPYDAIPMFQVRRIEVVKGPGSALYGGGALGGVIHVITRDYPESPESFVSVHGGAYQPVRYEAWRERWDDGDVPQPLFGFAGSYGRPLGAHLGLWAHVSYRYDAGHLRLATERNLQAYTKLTWRPTSDAHLSVLTGLARRKSDNFLFWNGARDPLNPGRIDFGRAEDSGGSDDNLVNELSLMPSYVDVLSDKLLLTARGRVFGVLIQPLDEAGKPKPLGQGTVGVRYGGEVEADFSPSDSRTITVGATADANAARSSYFADTEARSQPEGAVFAQWEESGVADVTLSIGARYDVYRVRRGVIESKLSPSVSASYAFSDRWIGRAAFGEGFRVPSVTERFVSNRDYLPLVSNLDLLPETSRSFELGVRGYPEIRSISVTVDGAAFWSDYRRLVEPVFVPAENAFQFVNLTRARIRGFEVMGSLGSVDERTRFQVGYTFLDAEDLTADRPLVFRSSHLLKASAGTRIWGIDLGADFRLASAPERVDSDFATFIKDAQIMVPVRVLDLRAGVTWEGVDATLHVKNSLDYYYVERPAILAPPRHVILQISTRF